MQNAFAKSIRKKLKYKLRHHKHLSVMVLNPDLIFHPNYSVFIEDTSKSRGILHIVIKEQMKVHIRYVTNLSRRSKVYDLKNPNCIKEMIAFIVRTIEKYHV